MRAAAQLLGEKRLAAYGRLDLDIMQHAAPWAVYGVFNASSLFSNRVDPKSIVFSPIDGYPSLGALALK
jgi:hypothetical protein